MSHDDALLDRYLLGQTSPEETDALELRLLDDPAFFELAQAAEFDLLERFAAGELGSHERLALTSRLHASPRLRERLAFSRALIDIADRHREPKPSWLARMRSFLLAPAARPAWAAAAVASIGAVWLGSQNVDLKRELETVAGIQERVTELETVNRSTAQDLANAREEARVATESEQRFRAEYTLRQQRWNERETRGRRVATVSLTATTRSGGEEKRFSLKREDTHVEIELDLPSTDATAPWTVIVRRDGVAVWTETPFPIERSSLGVIGILEMPRQSLSAGRYEIEVRSAAGSVASFPLTITGD